VLALEFYILLEELEFNLEVTKVLISLVDEFFIIILGGLFI
jgi:hypothetical protein